MKILVVGIVTIGGLWLISHFHYYHIQCSIWNLGINVYLVHGSFWTDVNYLENFYAFGEAPIFVEFEKEDYEPATSEADGLSPLVLKPTVRKTLLGNTVFKVQSGLPDFFISISFSIWLILLALCIGIISQGRTPIKPGLASGQ